MREWLMRAEAFVVAWTIVYLGLSAIDWATSWAIEPFGIAWICVGIGLRLQSERIEEWLALATPEDALRFLWRCATWPFHMKS